MIDKPPYDSNKRTVVEKTTVFDGGVSTDYSIEVRGTVKGTTASNSDIFVYNQCLGDVNGVNVTVYENGFVQQDIHAMNFATIRPVGNVAGVVYCNNADIYGVVNDVVAESTAYIRNGAIVKGDITCHQLVAEDYAKIEGMVYIVYNKNTI